MPFERATRLPCHATHVATAISRHAAIDAADTDALLICMLRRCRHADYVLLLITPFFATRILRRDAGMMLLLRLMSLLRRA